MIAPTELSPVNCVIEAKGPQELPDAVSEFLYSNADLLVVRDLVANNEDRRTLYDCSPLEPTIYDIVPELEAVDVIIGAFWQQRGYADYQLSDSQLQYLGLAPDGGIGIHTDYSGHTLGRVLSGPILLSLGITGSSTFYAERPPQSHRNNDDGSAHEAAWYEWTASKDRNNPNNSLRSSCQQREGDAVIITNHPFQAFHAVTVDSSADPRSGLMFEYQLKHHNTYKIRT